MSQYTTGTITTAAASSTVNGSGVDWTQIPVGSRIFIDADTVSFEIQAKTKDTLTLTANYPTTKIDVAYVIVQNFTSNIDLPLMSAADQKTAEIYTRAMYIIDRLFTAGFAYIGEFANSTTRNAYPNPEELNYCYQYDTGSMYVYIAGAWRNWNLPGVTVGPAGQNGFTPIPDWVSTTQLRWEVPAGVFSSPVELKGDAGAAGGLHWVGAWSSSASYVIDHLVSSGGIVYVCIAPHTNHIPPNASYWNVFLEPFGPGKIGGSIGGFNETTLDVNRHLIIADGIGTRPIILTILDASGKEIGPNVNQSDPSAIDVDFSTWPTLVGSYTFSVIGKTP